MKYVLITFRSVTPGQRAERLLQKEGVSCELRRTPRRMEEQGCGYCLRIRRQDMVRAVEALRKEDVAFRKVYLLSQDGNAEELTV